MSHSIILHTDNVLDVEVQKYTEPTVVHKLNLVGRAVHNLTARALVATVYVGAKEGTAVTVDGAPFKNAYFDAYAVTDIEGDNTAEWEIWLMNYDDDITVTTSDIPVEIRALIDL